MSEREKALTLLSTHGYLSKNILARYLESSLKHAGTVLESLSAQEGTVSFYIACKDRRITVHNKRVLGSVINAIGLKEKQAEFYNIEVELKNRFYGSSELVYPPADSGIYVQEKRNVVFLDKVVQNKPIVSCVSAEAKNSGGVVSKGQGNIGDKQAKIGMFAGVQGKPGVKVPVEAAKTIVGTKKEPENPFKSQGVPKKEAPPPAKPAKQVTTLMDICENPTEVPVADTEMVQAPEKDLKKPNTTFITPKASKKSTDHTETHPPVNQTKNSFTDLLSNKSLYTEEEDEQEQEQGKDSKSTLSKSLTPTKLPQKRPNPTAYKQPATNQTHLPQNPIKIKKKVIKTRTFLQGSKLITEDYSSEEEMTVNPASFGLGKKQGVQQVLKFKIG